MGHILENFKEYEKRGARVIGILAQNPEKVKEYLKEHGYPFPLLVDAERKVVKEYGVHVKANFESYNIARPANFILDRDGAITYMYIASNQMDFPPDEEIYAAFDSMGSVPE